MTASLTLGQTATVPIAMSFADWRSDQGSALSILGEGERISLWGFGL